MFAIGLFLHQLGGITWIAIHQLVDSLAKLVLTPLVGSMLDKTNRNRGKTLVFDSLKILVIQSYRKRMSFLRYAGRPVHKQRSHIAVGTNFLLQSLRDPSRVSLGEYGKPFL